MGARQKEKKKKRCKSMSQRGKSSHVLRCQKSYVMNFRRLFGATNEILFVSVICIIHMWCLFYS